MSTEETGVVEEQESATPSLTSVLQNLVEQGNKTEQRFCAFMEALLADRKALTTTVTPT